MLRDSQLWKSIFRHPAPTDRQGRVRVMVGNFLLHLHPTSIKQHALRPSFTWCMGGITFLLFLVETLTGVLLMFYYRPTIEWAYHDMLDLRDVVSFGIVREIHRWGAHAMVITVMLHMYRVFLTGSYKPPREFNWCDRRAAVGADAAALLHRLPAAVGPVIALGGDGGGEPGGRRPVPAPRRPVGGRRDAQSLLRAALHRPAAGGRGADGGAFLAGAEGRDQRAVVDEQGKGKAEGGRRKMKDDHRQCAQPGHGFCRLAGCADGVVSWPAVVRAARRGGGRFLVLSLVFLGVSLCDPQFAAVALAPDNIPIVAMLYLLGFFTWLATAQAVENDRRLRAGRAAAGEGTRRARSSPGPTWSTAS